MQKQRPNEKWSLGCVNARISNKEAVRIERANFENLWCLLAQLHPGNSFNLAPTLLPRRTRHSSASPRTLAAATAAEAFALDIRGGKKLRT